MKGTQKTKFFFGEIKAERGKCLAAWKTFPSVQTFKVPWTRRADVGGGVLHEVKLTHDKWQRTFGVELAKNLRLNSPWASSVWVIERNFGRSSPATISFCRFSGDAFWTGTSEPIVSTWGETTSIGDGSSEHCESHSGGGRKSNEMLKIKIKFHDNIFLIRDISSLHVIALESSSERKGCDNPKRTHLSKWR